MTVPETGEPIILLVDDNPDDILLVRRTFQRAGSQHRLLALTSGLDAIAYFQGAPPYGDRAKFPLPDLVLLDIKMPACDGFEVLRWVRHQLQFAQIPVVMLTSSDEIRDVNLAYKLGANSFLVKPLDFANAAELAVFLARMLQRKTSPTHFASSSNP